MAQYIAGIDARIPTGVAPWSLEDLECHRWGARGLAVDAAFGRAE
jgi:hypothetical protein